jgi:peptidyl-dipeptidase A
MNRLLSALVVAAALAGSALLSAQSAPGADEARKFLADMNRDMLRLINEANRGGWVQSTYITPDTELLAAHANELLVNAVTKHAKDARRFDGVQLPASDRRQFDVLKNSLTMSAPPDPKEAEELTRLVASMEGAYGSGKYCPKSAGSGDCLDIEKITEILAENRDPARLKEVWEGWHTVGAPMRKDYARFVELSNKGAAALDYPDTGAMWRGKYDMPPDAFAKELDRLWEQLRPLYLSLHTYVRARLHEKYGALVPEHGPIPAHLLGNLWQQDWSNIYDLVSPSGDKPVASLTDNLKSHKVEPLEMVRIGERFFTSLGFDPLPKTFWERSLFLKPRDRATSASRCASTSPKRTSPPSITSWGTTSTNARTARCR